MPNPAIVEIPCTADTVGVLDCQCLVCCSLRYEWADDGAEEFAERNRWSY